MWYKNIAGRFFGLVTKHARVTDGRADRRTELRVTIAASRGKNVPAAKPQTPILYGGVPN